MWRTRLTEYAESGLGQKAFYEQRGYSAKALRHWARKLHFVLPGVAGARNGTSDPRAFSPGSSVLGRTD
ncbi:IS66 family insertion sequence element accessory protein TnpA [Ameyamaea chiangmaiensis]